MNHKSLLGPDGQTPLRQYAGYQGAGAGFGGQLLGWHAPVQSADAALLPTLERGNARADDLVRNNGIATNILQLHKDHIVGNQFRLNYKPNWRYLGLERDPEFVKDVEAAFADVAEDPHCWLDAERKRTFTGLIRDLVAMHTQSGEAMAKPEWTQRAGTPYRTNFKLISPRRVFNPGRQSDQDRLRGGIELNRAGAATAVHIAEGDLRNYLPAKSRRVPMTLANGRVGFIHVFEPAEPDQTRGANQFLASMERMKMLDTLQQTKLQAVILASMYAATIETDLGSEEAMRFLLGTQSEAEGALSTMLTHVGDYYAAKNIKMNGSHIPHLMPGDKMNLLTPPNADSGYVALERSLFRWIAASTGFSSEQTSKDWSQVNYSSGRAGANESWRYAMGRRRLIANRAASLMFELIFEEMIARRIITLPRRARLGFYEARHAWTRSDWIGAGRMAMDGLKEIKESILLIEAGLSTYEKEAAKLGEDYQELFEQQVRETQERKAAGLPPPSWVKALALAPDQPEHPEQQEAANAH
jgi:lambda family phage portal protein